MFIIDDQRRNYVCSSAVMVGFGKEGWLSCNYLCIILSKVGTPNRLTFTPLAPPSHPDNKQPVCVWVNNATMIMPKCPPSAPWSLPRHAYVPMKRLILKYTPMTMLRDKKEKGNQD